MPKKKAQSIGVTVLAFLFLVISVPPSTSAIYPQPPNQFWGTVTVSESPAVDGLTVSARIGEVEYASTTTSGGSYGSIAPFFVPADNLETPEKDGGTDGDTVEFYVAGVKAAETGTFSVGGVTELNLTVDDVSPPTVTLPAYAPDSTTDSTPTYSGTATDALTNVVDIEYRVDGGAWTDVDAFTPALSVSFTFTTPTLADGTHTIYMRTRDAAGNLSAIVSDTLTVALPATDFSIGVSPTSGSVVQGGSTSATVSVSSIEGFSETVSLSASGLPSGATATFSPSSGTPSFSSTLTISTSTTTPAGTRTITITGTGGGKTHTYNFALTVTTVVVPGVPDFSIGVSPTSGSVVQGGSTSATVSVSSIEGFSSTVDLSASGLPSGATTSLSPASGTPSFTSTLTISTSSTTPAGTYTITITGTGGGKTRTCTYALTVTPAVPIPPGIIEVESPPVEIPFITPDENVIIEIENTIITRITIVVRESVENVRITVQQLTDKPAGIAIGTPGVAYRYLNIVAENISDADIDVVLIEFRVEKAWVSAENINPDTIALRRWDPIAGEWGSLPTTMIGEDDTYYYYSAESPGLSVFAVSGLTLGPAPAEFELSNLVVDPSEVGPGGTVTVSIAVTNVGEFEGTCTVTLKINNVVEATEDVTLAGGTTETVTFPVSRDVEGTYNVEVDGLTGTFVVTTPPPSPTVPLAIAVTGIASLAGVMGYFKYRQRKQARLRKTQLRRLKQLKKIEERGE